METSSGVFLFSVFGCFRELALCQGADLTAFTLYMCRDPRKVTKFFRQISTLQSKSRVRVWQATTPGAPQARGVNPLDPRPYLQNVELDPSSRWGPYSITPILGVMVNPP